MKAIEVTGKIDQEGNLILDEPIQGTTYPHQVRVIVLVPEEAEAEEIDPDDTPIEEIKASLRRALHQAKTGQTRPISEMWDGIDAER
ncbi:MAG: type II toxin-antitoxin system RelN family antitoxin [Hassallia sp.]